ncbi:HAD family hydrolase [Promicromonospora sp. MS192]|uniref:HAD family hydrolase n=1 Tax=Promicromonospora sp. MS192 TaxID=3412684 RepID=UPI003C2F1B99
MTTTYDISRQRGARLVALDIDGTLAIPGTTTISKAVREAVTNALEAEHHIVLSSGRSLVGVLPVARELGLAEGWAVASNGAVTVRLDPAARGGYRLHDVRAFDPAPVVRHARSTFPGVRVAAEVIGKGYRVTHLFAAHELSGEQMVVDLATAIGRNTTRLVLRVPGIAHLTGELSATGVTVIRDGNDWLDITAPRLSKDTALETVRDELAVDRRSTVAVGDGLNDVEMLRWAQRGVAMGHAPEVVQDAADEVTGTLHEDGAATVLNSLLLEPIAAGR